MRQVCPFRACSVSRTWLRMGWASVADGIRYDMPDGRRLRSRPASARSGLKEPHDTMQWTSLNTTLMTRDVNREFFHKHVIASLCRNASSGLRTTTPCLILPAAYTILSSDIMIKVMEMYSYLETLRRGSITRYGTRFYTEARQLRLVLHAKDIEWGDDDLDARRSEEEGHPEGQCLPRPCPRYTDNILIPFEECSRYFALPKTWSTTEDFKSPTSDL